MSEIKDVFKYVKNRLINEDLKYPELAVYESFVKHNADRWLDPKNATLIRDATFGISVIPNDYNDEIHNGVGLLKMKKDGSIDNGGTYLRHQVYLHDLLLMIWRKEYCSFIIKPITKEQCIVSL